MKTTIRPLLLTALIASAVAWPIYAEEHAAGFVDFGKFAPSAGGGEFVEVNIDKNILGLVAQFIPKGETEIKEVIQGLQGIRVNVVGMNKENSEVLAQKVAAVRKQLDDQGWQRVVTAQKDKEDVGVYLKLRGSEAIEGVVVTVLEAGKEAVFVNIIGNLRPEKIAALGEKLNIDPLKQAGEAINNTK